MCPLRCMHERLQDSAPCSHVSWGVLVSHTNSQHSEALSTGCQPFQKSRTCQALCHTATVATFSLGSPCKCHSSGLLACAVAGQGLENGLGHGLCICLCDTCSAATHRVSAGPAQLYASISREQAASSICAGTPGKERLSKSSTNAAGPGAQYHCTCKDLQGSLTSSRFSDGLGSSLGVAGSCCLGNGLGHSLPCLQAVADGLGGCLGLTDSGASC
jgi:hypothetical protein